MWEGSNICLPKGHCEGGRGIDQLLTLIRAFVPRACLFPASSAWVGVIKSLLPSPQTLPCSGWHSKLWETVNSHQLWLGVCADSLRGIPGAVSTTLGTPLSFSFLG